MINIDILLTQLLNGIVLGLTYVLISMGLSIIFGTMGIVNFAHGDILLVGAYVSWMSYDITNIFLLSVIIGGLAAGVLGAAIEYTTIRRVYEYDPTLQLLLTFGLAELLRGLVIIIWGRSGKLMSAPNWLSGSIDFGILTYPSYRLAIVLFSSTLIIIFYYILNGTDIGLIIRAGTYDRETVQTLGIDVSKMFLIVFAMGAAVAGIAGGLISPIRGVQPQLGVNLLIPSFVVVIVGGIGSFKGSIVGGIVIGVVIVMTGVVFSSASQVIIYILMAVVLFIRPKGLYGKGEVF